MPQPPAHTQRICADCDGHATAYITTGRTHRDGTRHTLPVTCPGCHGTGTTPAADLATARR
ncbi:hypothetical protein [Streptomyces chumphonensis]|uniref:hypothetical protein n=1 Tax=Streptomyces chumphonensis TaxID=1214925 RepID=UPI003D71F328